MRNMSFFMTTEQVRNQTKTVTRRFGWWFAKVGDVYQPVVKSQGLKKGEKIEKINGPIEVVSTEEMPLNYVTKPDLIREGFPKMERWEFIGMLMKVRKCTISEPVNRIEFKYLPPAKNMICTTVGCIEDCIGCRHAETHTEDENCKESLHGMCGKCKEVDSE